MTSRHKIAIAIMAGVLLLAVIVYIGFTQFNKPVEPVAPVAEASVSTEAEEPIEAAEPAIEEPEIAEAEEPVQNEVTVADLPDEELEYDYGDLGKLGDLLALMEGNDDLRFKWIDAGCPNPGEESDMGSWERFIELVGEDPLTGEIVEVSKDEPEPAPAATTPNPQTPAVTPPQTVASDTGNGFDDGNDGIEDYTSPELSEASQQSMEEWYAEQGMTVGSGSRDPEPEQSSGATDEAPGLEALSGQTVEVELSEESQQAMEEWYAEQGIVVH